MSSILEELKKKRMEEGRAYLNIGTSNSYSNVEKEEKERQEQFKSLEKNVQKQQTTSATSKLVSGIRNVFKSASFGTTADTVVANVANQLGNIKAAAGALRLSTTNEKQLLDYAKGNHNITNSLAVKRLEMSEAAKNVAPVAVMLDEIKRGTYKGTAEDIKKTLNYGEETNYAKWYNQKIAPSVNRAKASQEANTSMYGKTLGGIMNFGANAVSGIGQFAANTVLGGPIYAGAMAGLSRDSSGNVQQIRNEGLDQVAKDIGVDVGLGALFSYLMGEGTGAINSAIQNSIPKSVLSKAGIIARNVVAGAGGAYASVGTTGTLRNIYNKLQGREVSQEDALKPWWSTDTAIATFMGALFNGINGTKSDLAKAEQIRAVMNKQGELNAKLTGLSKDIAKQFEAGNQQGVETSYNSGKQAIEEFFNRNNLGKVTNTLKNEYLRQWFEYNYDLGIKYETLTNPGATNTTPQTGPSLLTAARPTQQATVVPPPSTYTPSTPLTNTANNNIINPNQGGAKNDSINIRFDGLNGGSQSEKADSRQNGVIYSEIPENKNGDISLRGGTQENNNRQTDVGVSGETGVIPKIRYIDRVAANSAAKFLGISPTVLSAIDITDIEKAKQFLINKTNIIEKYAEKEKITGQELGKIEKSSDFRNYLDDFVKNIIVDNKHTIAEIMEEAKKNHGVTEDFNVGAWMTTDGELLNFKNVNNVTGRNNHSDIDVFGMDESAFMDARAIRMVPNRNGIELSTMPTPEQFEKIADYYNNHVGFSDVGDTLIVDIRDGDNSFPLSFQKSNHDTAATVENAIKDFFNEKDLISEPNSPEIKNENSTQGSFSMPKNLPEELPSERRKFLKEFKQVGYVNIKGVKITSIDDLADVAQVFRDPIAETFRVIFMKGDTIVGQSGYTTGSVRQVGIGNAKRFAGQVDLWADGFGADSYYLIHNHPDGRVEPSSGDISATKHISSYTNIPLKGHIVIDHNEFSAIYRDGTTQKHIKLRNNTYNEIEKDFSKEGWANMPVKNMDQIAALSSYVKNDKDFSTVIWADSNYVPTVLQSLPNSFFESNTKSKLVDYMQKVGRENGADYVMLATQSQYAFGDFMRKGPNTPAAVMYSANKDGSLKIVKADRSNQLHLYNNNRKNPQQIAPMEGVQMQEPSTSLEEIKKQYETKQPEVKKEPPKKLEPPKKKEQPTKTEKKQPAKRLEKKQPEPDKRLGFDAVDKDKEALEKANDKLRDELAKQKEKYDERLEKRLERFKEKKKEQMKNQRQRQKLALKKREEKKKEEQRFKDASSKGKLRMLTKRIEKQTGYYEISDFPELDSKYEREFGKTIRQTIKTLKSREVFPYLPAKVQDVVNTFADETYLRANWKTFDRYVKEALQIDEIKKLAEESDTPVGGRLRELIKEHKTAPITVKTIKEMYDDLQILADIVELAQERLDYRREPEGWKETVDKAGEELKEIAEGNTPKSFSTTSAKLGKASDNLQSLGSAFSQFKTRIQELFGGDPENPFMRIWDEFQAGDETKAKLDVLFSRNFDGLVEGKPGKYKMKGELQKDFSENAQPIDTGIKGTNPKTGKEYSENAMLPKKIIMHIVASSKNDDNLMSFSKILLGTDYKGNPVYSNPGGYIVPDDYYLQRGNINLAYKNGKKYVFTKQDIEHLEKLLTPEEKEFVDAALKVGDITAKYGNEVSQKLIGRDLFTVKNYIRIIRDESEFDPELIDPTKLDNLANATSEKYIGISGLLGRGGSLEGRNHRSTRPIYGESLRQSVTNSFRGAIKYIAYALPLYDTDFLLKARLPDKFEQVETVEKEPKSTKDLTYKKVDELPRNGADHTRYYIDNGDHYTVYRVKEKGETVRDLIIKTGDKGFDDYYNQFVDSIVGKGKPYSKFSSMRAKVVLNANLRVAATQFFSYFQMGQFLDHPASSMLKAIADRGTIAKLAKDFLEKDGKDIKGLKGQELINRFIEYISYKNSQRGLGMFSDDIRYVETGSSVLGRVNTGRLMSIVDKFTVDRTYKALILDIMAEGKEFGSKEFMDEFKSRLYAIYQSNPMYGEIYKTPFQNNSGRYSEITRALSQFQTVMFEGFNNGKQAKMAYEYYKKKGDEKNAKKYAKRFRHHVQGLIISGLALVALRDYLDRLSKKENDEDYAKKITMDFISNMLSYTIVGDEIFNALFNRNNYDLTTNELSYFNTALDTFGEMGTLVAKPTPPNAIKLIKSLGQTIGLPTGSIENTFGILSNLTSDNAFKAYSVLKDNNKYQKWLKNQDAIGTDFKTFYEISQAVKEKTLAEKYGYVKGSETGTYGSLSYAKGRAIMDVLGIEQGKKMTKEQKQAYTKWYNIFKN